MDGTSQKIILDILLFMGEEGIRYKTSEIEDVLDYVERMLSDERILVIYDDNKMNTVLFFSVCNDYMNYLRKPTWIYKEHNPYGKMVYIEKIVSKTYNKEIRLKIQHLIMSLYPTVRFGKWHVFGKIGDRETTTTPKEISCHNSEFIS